LNAELEGSLVTIGQMVTVETASGNIEGEATGLSPAGHLLVNAPGGLVEIVAGDIVHLRPVRGTAPEAG
jgi:BirA family biotin operon repressor/biotin-[acetyl-CoA-carboxylase] ligase